MREKGMGETPCWGERDKSRGGGGGGGGRIERVHERERQGVYHHNYWGLATLHDMSSGNTFETKLQSLKKNIVTGIAHSLCHINPLF